MSNPVAKLRESHNQILEELDRLELSIRRIGMSCFPLEDFCCCQEQLQNFFNFMQTAAVLHTRQEEGALFPSLARLLHRSGDTETLVDRFESEHRKAQSILDFQKRQFDELKQRRPLLPKDYFNFCSAMLNLLSFYRHHIWKENNILFPLAERVLSEDEWDRVQFRMQNPESPNRTLMHPTVQKDC